MPFQRFRLWYSLDGWYRVATPQEIAALYNARDVNK
jgi:hypothetical protein